MEMNIKLPAKYYQFEEKTLDGCSETKRKRVSVTFSIYQACKLEQFAVKNEELISDMIRKFLIENKIIDEKEAFISGKKKFSSSFIGKNCDDFKELGGVKTYHISISECGEIKLYKYLLKNNIDMSFFVKKELVKRGIFEIEDLSY